MNYDVILIIKLVITDLSKLLYQNIEKRDDTKLTVYVFHDEIMENLRRGTQTQMNDPPGKEKMFILGS